MCVYYENIDSVKHIINTTAPLVFPSFFASSGMDAVIPSHWVNGFPVTGVGKKYSKLRASTSRSKAADEEVKSTSSFDALSLTRFLPGFPCDAEPIFRF